MSAAGVRAARSWPGGLLAAVTTFTVVTACGRPASSSHRGVVGGSVVSAPSCPVERSGSPCPPRPVSGARVEALVAARVVASVHTDRAGRFRLSLPYGDYVIRAVNNGPLHTTTTRGVRLDRSSVSVRLVVDSGIR